MNDELAALGQRVMACKGWRWMPGMLAADTGLRLDEMTDYWQADVPDLSDPGTLGCLLQLCREAWSDPLICVGAPGRGKYSIKEWHVIKPRNLPTLPAWIGRGATEAEALVAALEAAP